MQDCFWEDQINGLNFLESKDVLLNLYILQLLLDFFGFVHDFDVQVSSPVFVKQPNLLMVFFNKCVDWGEDHVSVAQGFASHPGVLVAENYLVKAFLLRYECHLDHVFTAFDCL